MAHGDGIYQSGGPTFTTKQKQAMSWGLQPLVLEERTATADDVTPDIANVNVLKIGANSTGTAITQLDGGIAGQVMVLIGTSATNSSTIADSGNFKRLAKGFPEEAEAMQNFQHTKDWWAEVEDRAEDKKNLTFGVTTIHEVKS